MGLTWSKERNAPRVTSGIRLQPSLLRSRCAMPMSFIFT